MTVSAEEPIAYLYVQWEAPPKPWTLRCGEHEQSQGEQGFFHEFVVLPEPSVEVEMQIYEKDDAVFAEIMAFGVGTKPDWVQDWQAPQEQADLLVIPTHSDDEFIFLGGLIPKSVAEGLRVQVVYIVEHHGFRRHEMLDSLWEAGVRNYPVTSRCADIYVDTVGKARREYGSNYMTGFLVEQIRRFRPQVVVGQAEDGDSGHPVHIFGVECLKAALEQSAVTGAYPESEEKYGLYDVPKAYLHRYGPEADWTVLDYETPLEHFGGATAFDMAERAFQKCVTQYKDGKYHVYGVGSEHDSHCFGLYRTLLGPDEEKNDLFEHVDLALLGEKNG